MKTLGDYIEGGFPGREWQEFEKAIFQVKSPDIFFDGTFSPNTGGATYRDISQKLTNAYQYLWQSDGVIFDSSVKMTCNVIPFIELPKNIFIDPEELLAIKEKANSVLSDQHEVPERKKYCMWMLKAIEEIDKYSLSNVANYKRKILKLPDEL
jgi:hypothetical protein